jgi:hypothetical protein
LKIVGCVKSDRADTPFLNETVSNLEEEKFMVLHEPQNLDCDIRKRPKIFVYVICWLAIAVAACSAIWYCTFCIHYHVDATGTLEFVGGGNPNPNHPSNWRIRLMIPEEDVSRISDFANTDADVEVNYLITSTPISAFRGKLPLKHIVMRNGEAHALVRIHPINGDLPKEECVSEELLLLDGEVLARIRSLPW